MGDVGDDFRAFKEYQRKRRAQLGEPCPQCMVNRPKAQPKILMPGQLCWCGYRDPRPDDRAQENHQ